MARNRGRQRQRNRRQKFADVTHARRVAHLMNDERHKEEQLEYLKAMSELKLSILARTIFVDNVCVDRLNEIRAHFDQTYGPVEECRVAQKRHARNYRGPRVAESVRVRFLYEDHAVRALGLHGSTSFVYARNHRRYVMVCKSQEYDGMLRTVVKGSEIPMSAHHLALGHFFSTAPADSEADWDGNASPVNWLEEKSVDDTVNIKIDLIGRYIELSIETPGQTPDEINYAHVRFKELFGPIEVCQDAANDVYSLVISLKHPPKLFTKDLTAHNADDNDPTRGLVFGLLHAEDFGACCSLKLNVGKASIFGLLQNEGLSKLRSFGVIPKDFHSLDDVACLVTQHVGSGNADAEFASLQTQDPTMGLMLRSCMDSYKFCWYDALNNRILHSGTSTQYNIFTFLQSMCQTDLRHAVVLALGKLAQSTIRTRCPCSTIQSLVEFVDKKSTLPGHCVTIPRILLSPSKNTVLGIEVETSNRVVRDFVEKEGFSSNDFLRVKVGDENGRKLFWDDFTAPVVARIESDVGRGLMVNGQLYQFLAYSSSQLKDCSLWMVHVGSTGWTVESMRQRMGDFSKCTTPSKVAARMGQCFSTTFQGLDGYASPQQNNSGVRHILVRDIPSATNDLVHSDGNGMIRRSTMTALLKQIPSLRKNQEAHHSIVQIRFGGAKGTLVAWDDDAFDAVLTASGCDDPCRHDVAIRDSMVKFDAPFSQLEVCSIGSAAPYYLNRNVIFLLRALGVDESVFLHMQTEMLDDLDEMFRNSTTASNMIAQLSGPDPEQRLRLMNMLKCGLEIGKDPFLFSCSLAIRSHQLFGLRKKSRIYVKDGAVLMGGIDVLKVLPEYCVFVQVRKSTPGANGKGEELEEYAPIVGPVMVTKHPVMHPGDVRMLLAVEVPELRNHKNVILFSQLGDRPESDKMGGSDLDGDGYAVSWDPRLYLGEWNMCSQDANGHVVSRNGRVMDGTNMVEGAKALQFANSEPLSYTSGGNSLTSMMSNLRLGTMDQQLIRHFVNFAINDKLGPICMLWLDWAAKYGAACNECILLAEQHSIAVDFAKSGIPAAMPRETKWEGLRAHWREKKEGYPYHCTTVVGKLYDQVSARKGLASLPDYSDALAARSIDRYGQVGSIAQNESDIDEALERVYKPHIPSVLGWSTAPSTDEGSMAPRTLQDHLSRFADEQRAAYEDAVMQVMNKYDLRSEGELATGCIRKYQKLNKNRQHEVAEEVRRMGREIYREQRNVFFRQVLMLAKVSRLSSDQNKIVVDFDRVERMEESEVLLDDLDWVKSLVTTRLTVTPDESSKEWMVRAMAMRLAAAYYLATYSPWRETHEGILLFGFPWVVSDVVACGIAAAPFGSP